MNKTIVCPDCSGRGIISYGNDHSIWSETCNKCRGYGLIDVPFTNADVLRAMSDEDLITLVRAVLKVEDCPVPGDHDCEKCFFKTICSHTSEYLGNELEWLRKPVEE